MRAAHAATESFAGDRESMRLCSLAPAPGQTSFALEA